MKSSARSYNRGDDLEEGLRESRDTHARIMQSPMNAGIRPFRTEDEPALRRVMEAALQFDAYPGFNAWDLDTEAVSIVGTPDGVAVAVVEAENELALGLYRRTGFEPVVEWPHWTRPVSARPSPDDR
jgi:hypothetical protein